jgi:nitrogen fixation NifU-like protein
MQLQDMYQEIILDHYRNPHHKGLRDPFDAQVYHVNPTCGDEVTLRVALKPGVDGEAVVEDVSFESLGCSISQASASVMTDLVIGKPVSEAMKIEDAFLELMKSKGQLEPDEDVLEDAVAFAGVSKYPARIKCALLGWMAWKDATAQALSSPGGQPSGTGDSRPPSPPAPVPPAARPMGQPDDIGRADGSQIIEEQA